MSHEPPRRVRDALPEQVAARLLERASELDAAQAAHSVELTALRAAADEAGISERAFNQALAELEAGSRTPAPGGKLEKTRRRGSLAVVAAAMVVGMLFVSRLVLPGPQRVSSPAAAAPAMIDMSYTMPCTPSVEALNRMRTGLGRANLIRLRGESRVLEVRATPAQHREIKAMLARLASDGTLTCRRE